MSQAKASVPSSVRADDRVWESEEERAAYERRLRAAGLVPGADPEQDIDAFRNQLARRINMLINKWHGCPEPLCKRNRGCMAPDIQCANIPQPTPEEMERDGPRVQAEFYKALKARRAALDAEEA